MAIVSLLVAARSVSILGAVHLSGRLICESYRTLNSYLCCGASLCVAQHGKGSKLYKNSL